MTAHRRGAPDRERSQHGTVTIPEEACPRSSRSSPRLLLVEENRHPMTLNITRQAGPSPHWRSRAARPRIVAAKSPDPCCSTSCSQTSRGQGAGAPADPKTRATPVIIPTARGEEADYCRFLDSVMTMSPSRSVRACARSGGARAASSRRTSSEIAVGATSPSTGRRTACMPRAEVAYGARVGCAAGTAPRSVVTRRDATERRSGRTPIETRRRYPSTARCEKPKSGLVIETVRGVGYRFGSRARLRANKPPVHAARGLLHPPRPR